MNKEGKYIFSSQKHWDELTLSTNKIILHIIAANNFSMCISISHAINHFVWFHSNICFD